MDFQQKRPDLRGNWKERCGDNFYELGRDGVWQQHRNRFHFQDHYAKDIKYPKVFIASKYWYFGNTTQPVPKQFAELVGGRGIRTNHNEMVSQKFKDWVETSFDTGVHGNPLDNPDLNAPRPAPYQRCSE
ncbi:MAG: hypothetical protein H7X83_10090 [Verrucomicrobia bacterium]|nr:hypothetical protein [Deltaproteobacteria bacterium]